MRAMKIRRQGRSLAVTLDADTLRGANLKEGDLVQPSVEDGRVVLTPVSLTPRVRAEVLRAIDRTVARNRHLLKRLAEYDSR